MRYLCGTKTTKTTNLLKTSYVMKPTAIFAALVALMFSMSGICSMAQAQEAPGKKFVNVIKQDGRPAQKVVYRVSGSELFNHKQFVYTYDAQDRVAQVDINLWNDVTSAWEPRYSATYTYGPTASEFTQQVREFRVGTLQYEIIADQGRIREIMEL